MNCCIDWLTFTLSVKNSPVDDAFELASEIIPDIAFNDDGWQLGNGRYMFDKKFAYQGIEILFDGKKKSGLDGYICLNITGQGCRTWEEKQGDIMELLRYVDKNAYNVSRIDLAVDDREQLLDIDLIYKLSGVRVDRRGKLNHDCYWWGNSRVNSRTQGTDGCTCYYGAPSSDIRIRIYDKAAEQKISEPWVRVEVVVRAEKAGQVVRDIIRDNEPGKLFTGILRNQLFFFQSLLRNLTRRTQPGTHSYIYATGGNGFYKLPNLLN